jgi:hypothetical protein
LDVTPRELTLRLGTLVVDGLPPGEHDRLPAALSDELARLLAERGVPPELVANHGAAYVPGAAVTVAAGARVERVAAQLAESIYRGWQAPRQRAGQGPRGGQR